MGKIKVLDCTLRDGGYCNQWEFGHENIQIIVKKLCDANVDIVEGGFLTERIRHTEKITMFNTKEEIDTILPANKRGRIFVAMINYSEFDISKLPVRNKRGIDGIRLAFHKRNRKEALELSYRIKEKGYLLFLQPMVTLSYSDEEFLRLITESNKLEPAAFYIVDSFGTMKKKELIRLFYLVEHNLSQAITIGFHSHNNMQLAYANAQTLTDIHTKHDLIIDTSIYGMGRGAGNLNTEIFLDYLNGNFNGKYLIQPLIEVIDEILDVFYKKNSWGYSLPNYLSASHNAHPNYAGFLSDKNTLTAENMDAILEMMDDEKRIYFDRKYIEELYLNYLSAGKVYKQHKNDLEEILSEKMVLLIAPGRSSFEERERIKKFSENPDVVVISVNHEYPYTNTNFIFVSNLRRFKEIKEDKRKKCIVTSNISSNQVYLQTKYQELLNDDETVRDNAGLMAVKFLILYGIRKIILAGFDGYSYDSIENYADEHLLLITKKALVDEMNKGIKEVLKKYSHKTEICFLTKQKYIRL